MKTIRLPFPPNSAQFSQADYFPLLPIPKNSSRRPTSIFIIPTFFVILQPFKKLGSSAKT